MIKQAAADFIGKISPRLPKALAVVATLAPIVGGWLIETTSYTVLFGLTTVVLIAGFAVSLTMRSTYGTANASSEA